MMADNPIESLRDLQRIDLEIDGVRSRIAEFEPLLEKLEEPALKLEKETEAARSRLQEMKLDERRLELSADERRARMKKLQERLNTVRNLREEAAVHAELDLVRRALEADEQEALTLLDQIRQAEAVLEEAERNLDEARQEIEPKRLELVKERKSINTRLSKLKSQREESASRIPEPRRRIYESLKARGRSIILAELTPDGACGHCYSMIPLQLQTEIRASTAMIRCETCGVIMIPRDPGASE
jgi:predicted  nucleic acid-binding Zn-ribbon protein